jgi:hypothetical protein
MTSLTPTSYFSEPSPELDPTLFQGRELKAWARQGILQLLSGFFDKRYRHSELWSHPWLAGSGVSYQWSANRVPKDLDCLVGIDFVQFRQANPEYRGLTDKEISDQLNEEFRAEIQPLTENWNGYELTFYVNPKATDITAIKPYAAYDLKYNEWTVTPSPLLHGKAVPEWDSVALSDYTLAHNAHTRATKAMQDLEMTHSGPQKVNAEATLRIVYNHANALYNEIHTNRSEAFSAQGEGYNDFHNYRWQAAKGSGTIELLKEIKSVISNRIDTGVKNTYGVELPSSDTLIRRATMYRASN